jgi:hypothetical protein
VKDARYPGYDVLAKRGSPDWDAPTREVVRRRLEDVPAIRFFTEEEARTLEAVAECIVPQADRGITERIPIVPWLDDKLAEDRRDGYRYETLPPQREAWRLGLAGIDQAAALMFGGGLAAIPPASRAEVLRRVEAGDPPGAAWRALEARRFFRDVLLISIVKTYYAHPTAWNEVGYNGPSSPRGHVRKRTGRVDPWEAREAEDDD